ncbi:hypothetical protein LB506_003920 [Fusarium annulatum]|nr:hypothetical protein LB506_003920 [Fusarium annulatum]
MSRTTSSNTPTLPQAVQERGSLRTLEKGKSQFIGSSSGIYFVNTVRRAFINANSRLSSRLLDTAHPTPEECIVADGEDEQQRPDVDASLLPSSFSYGHGIPTGLGRPPQPDVAKQLFMTYFQTWHRFFPFLHGPTILRDMEDLYSSLDENSRASEPIPPRVPTTLPKVVILQCIFNLASLHNSSQLPVASEIQKPTDLLSYLPGLAVKGDLVSIQALFAAGLLLVARMSLRAASVVSGLLSRAVFLAGLHRCPCRYGKLTADECDIRKRLFWCIYVFDRYLSQALGHPLGIQDSDVDVCPLDGPELHHPLLYPTVPSSYRGVASPFSGLSAMSVDATITGRQSEAGLGRATSEDESSQKHNRHSSLSFQVQYSRLLGRALELFHKSLHIRSIDSGSILSLQTDINALWNALPSSLQEFDPSSCDTTDRNQSQVFNESAHFILLHSQLVLLIHRPRLSLEPSTPEFQSAIQICINEAREIIKITSKQINAGYALFWPGYLSVTWMAGIVLAFACQLRLYSAEKGKREIEAIQEMEHTAKRPAFEVSDSTFDSVHSGRDSVSSAMNYQSDSRKRARLDTESNPRSSQRNDGSGQPLNQIPADIVNVSMGEPLGSSFEPLDATDAAIEDDIQYFGDPGRLIATSVIVVTIANGGRKYIGTMSPARGRAACKTCRSRKQKCDGIRGPPKGYTKALEARLAETELVLIRLLHATNDEGLLAHAFDGDTQKRAHKRFGERNTEFKSSGIGEHKMLALMDHWERFPLRTADDVRQWIGEVSKTSMMQGEGTNQSSEKMRGLLRAESSSGNVDYQHEDEVQNPAGAGDDMAAGDPYRDDSVDQDSIGQPPQRTESVGSIQPACETHAVQDITTSSRIELPADFKDRFLW